MIRLSLFRLGFCRIRGESEAGLGFVVAEIAMRGYIADCVWDGFRTLLAKCGLGTLHEKGPLMEFLMEEGCINFALVALLYWRHSFQSDITSMSI